MTPATRRQFLIGATGLAGAAVLGGVEASYAVGALPAPGQSGIDHIIVLMMENRSFDHYLGWLKGADGKQAGLSYVDRDGVSHKTHHLVDYQGCAHPDPDHSYEGGRVQLNGGKCDGFLRSGDNDEFAIGYYTNSGASTFPTLFGPTMDVLREFTRTDIDDAIELRGVLEGTAARLAAERLESDDELDPLRDLCRELDGVVRTQSLETFMEYLRLNEEFHEAFDTTEGDGLWLAPDERVRIW